MSRSMWRVAGGLAIAYVVLTLAGLAIGNPVPQPGASEATVLKDFSTGEPVRTYAALYVTALSLLVFLALGAFVARALRASAPAGWAASTALGASVLYAVASGLDVVVLGAETYGGHHGAAGGPLTLLDGVRAFAIYGSFLALGLFVLATAVAATSLPRWVVYSGLALGTALALSVALAATGLPFLVYLASFVWFAGLGVTLIRRLPALATV